MIITIFRHGEAGAAATDERRELTVTGVDDIRFGSHQFRSACEARDIPGPDLILHSAWLRTTQTAKILAACFPQSLIRNEASLVPGGRVTAVTETLSGLRDQLEQQELGFSHVLLVSHQPLVSQLVDSYLGSPHSAPPLSPGGLVSMDMDIPAADCARLLFWALPPEYGAGL